MLKTFQSASHSRLSGGNRNSGFRLIWFVFFVLINTCFLTSWGVVDQVKSIQQLYAVEVIDYRPGLKSNGNSIEPPHADPSMALGKPEMQPGDNYVSMGFGGEIILRLEELPSEPGLVQLEIVASGTGKSDCKDKPEMVEVYVGNSISSDLSSWKSLGIACRGQRFDISGFEPFQLVYLQDISNPGDFSQGEDGYDLEGVILSYCIDCLRPTSVPAPSDTPVPSNTSLPTDVLTLSTKTPTDPTVNSPTLQSFTPTSTVTDSSFSTETLIPTLSATKTPTQTPTFTETREPLACVGKPLDVVLVIDRSSSMSGNRLDQAKQAAQLFVALMNLQIDQIGLVSFWNSSHLDQNLTQDRDAMIQAIDSLKNSEGTNIAAGISDAWTELISSRHNPLAEQIIILLSDGRQSKGNALLASQEAKQQGALIITISLGEQSNEDLMRSIASSEKDYYHAPETSDLIAIYQSIAEVIKCGTLTPARTPTSTPSNTAVANFTSSATSTPSAILTATPKSSHTPSPTTTHSRTPTETSNASHTPTPTSTASHTSTPSPTNTAIITFTPSVTPAFPPTQTPSITPALPITPSHTPSPIFIPTSTPTSTKTFTSILTPSRTRTQPPSSTFATTLTSFLTPTSTLTSKPLVTTQTATVAIPPLFTPTVTQTPTVTPPNQPVLWQPSSGTVLPQPILPDQWIFLWYAPPKPCHSIITIDGPDGEFVSTPIYNSTESLYKYVHSQTSRIANNKLEPWSWWVTVICPTEQKVSEVSSFSVNRATFDWERFGQIVGNILALFGLLLTLTNTLGLLPILLFFEKMAFILDRNPGITKILAIIQYLNWAEALFKLVCTYRINQIKKKSEPAKQSSKIYTELDEVSRELRKAMDNGYIEKVNTCVVRSESLLVQLKETNLKLNQRVINLMDEYDIIYKKLKFWRDQ